MTQSVRGIGQFSCRSYIDVYKFHRLLPSIACIVMSLRSHVCVGSGAILKRPCIAKHVEFGASKPSLWLLYLGIAQLHYKL